MAIKKETNVSAEKMAVYKKLIETNSKIELKGAAIPYTSYNGHMFSYFEKEGTFGLRLPEKERDEFLEKYKTTLFVSYGIVKKEFVLVPEHLFKKIDELKSYFDISFKYVASLKPK